MIHVAIAQGSDTLLFIALLPKMNVVRSVLLDQFFRNHALRGAPDEIHFRMRRAQCKSSFENQKHAAIKQKKRTEQAHDNWNPSAARAGGQAARIKERHAADGHAGGDK